MSMKSKAPELDAQILAAWRDGGTISQIGTALGVSRNIVAGRISRMRVRGEKLDRRGEAPGMIAGKKRMQAVHSGALPPFSGCRFIAGNDFLARLRRGEPIYCGKPIAHVGESWCATHRAVVFTPAKPRARY